MEHYEPKQAHRFLKEHPDALFVDCRSEMEYMFVGHPIGAMMIPWYDGAEWAVGGGGGGGVKPHVGKRGEGAGGNNLGKGPGGPLPPQRHPHHRGGRGA